MQYFGTLLTPQPRTFVWAWQIHLIGQACLGADSSLHLLPKETAQSLSGHEKIEHPLFCTMEGGASMLGFTKQL